MFCSRHLGREFAIHSSCAAKRNVSIITHTCAGSLLQDIMSTDLTVTTPETSLNELKSQFGAVSGLPVVKSKDNMVLVGVVSRKDLLKAGDKVSDVRFEIHFALAFFQLGQCLASSFWIRVWIRGELEKQG